jgi:hypothetical protein
MKTLKEREGIEMELASLDNAFNFTLNDIIPAGAL